MTITDTAHRFFDVCETGKGWSVCQAWSHDGGTSDLRGHAIESRHHMAEEAPEALAQALLEFLAD